MLINQIETKSILVKTKVPAADYAANPYVGCPTACRYCYACFMRRFTGHPEAWGEFLDVKFWRPLRDAAKFDGKTIIIGTVTDPYNVYEQKYERTRCLLNELRPSTAEISLLTKSDLVLRDMDLIAGIRNIKIVFSINTLDENFRKKMERGVSVQRRIEAMRQLRAAGIATATFISPIFPEITEVPAICQKVAPFCDEIWLENLNLRGSFKADILGFIASDYPELLPLYQQIYRRNDRAYWLSLANELEGKLAPLGKKVINYFFHSEIKKP